MGLIEDIARAMAQETNGGDWDNPNFYHETHKMLWRQRATIALRVIGLCKFKDNMPPVPPENDSLGMTFKRDDGTTFIVKGGS